MEIKYLVTLFKTVTMAMKAENLLLEADVPHKLIPVPKSISSDCGICLRFSPADKKAVLDVLKGRVEYSELMELQ